MNDVPPTAADIPIHPQIRAPALAEEESIIGEMVRRIWWYRRLFLAVILIGLVIAGGIAFAMSKHYTLTTVIEIGRANENMVETSDTVMNKVSQAYVPLVSRLMLSRYPQFEFVPEVNAVNPKGSSLVVLLSKVTLETLPLYEEIHAEILRHLQEDHQRVLITVRKRLELDLNGAQAKSEDIVDQLKTIASQVTTLEEEKKLVHRQIEDIRRQIDISQNNRQEAGKNVDSQARVLTLLMLDQPLMDNRNRLATLEQQMAVGLVNQNRALEQKIADTKREQTVQSERITSVKISLANLQETRAVVPTQRSLQPVSMRLALRLGVSALAAVAAACVICLFVDWVNRTLHSFNTKPG